MPLKMTVEKLDDVDEALRTLYVEKDGKFHLSVDGIEDTAPLKNALQKERAARGELEKKVKSWEKSGKSPEDIDALLEQQRKDEEYKLQQAGEWDKLKAQMNAKHQEDLKVVAAKVDAKEKEVSSMRTTLEQHLVDAQVTSAIAANDGIPDLLLPHVQRNVKVVEKDGHYSIMVVDKDGSPRVNGKGDPLSISELVSEMKTSDIFGRAFKGSGHSGSGTRPNSSAGGSGGIAKRSELKNEKDRSAFIDEFGLDAYKALPM